MRIIGYCLWAVLCLALSGCGDNESQAPVQGVTEFATDVPLIRESMLSASYWVNRLDSDTVRMDVQAIKQFNAASFSVDKQLYNLSDFPQILSRDHVLALIDGVSRPASSTRYHENGQVFGDSDYAELEIAVDRVSLPAEVSVQWGVVVERASMRSYPTFTRVLKSVDDRDLDRFQETGVFPGQRLALLHESADGQWWFAVNYHYAAWVPKKAVAVGEREQLEQWYGQSSHLMVTGASVYTNYNPEDARTSEVRLDMGVSLPLLSAKEVGHNVHGQNPFASYIVSLPVRAQDGALEFVPALIGRGRDVSVGPLAYRPSQILRQAFKFLGERYGWGHDYNARDCTGFVGEVYKSLGILMPRNSGQQGTSDFAPTQTFAEGDHAARVKALKGLSVGDLIYIPGHVMMYIGEVDGEPYVIHDVTGLRYFTEDQTLYSGTLSGVSVTPLTPLYFNREKSFVDAIYAIKTII